MVELLDQVTGLPNVHTRRALDGVCGPIVPSSGGPYLLREARSGRGETL